MTERIYLISGNGYSLYFDSIKQRNQFNRLFDEVMNKMYKDGCNYAAMAYSISKVIAGKMQIKIESINN
jgi:hypothetical protein